jgi:gamma-glutamylcyclotransferase (GGCT)/AIG2-like uncharacterized protein YtfP
MAQHLFVYGSLMPHMGGPFARGQRARLAAETEIAGPATIRGWMFNLGQYPGLVLAQGDPSATTVHGVLLRLKTPDPTFQWLDPFEDIEPGRAEEMNGYTRVATTVTTEGDNDIEAWVYLMRHVPRAASEIPSGRWHAPVL